MVQVIEGLDIKFHRESVPEGSQHKFPGVRLPQSAQVRLLDLRTLSFQPDSFFDVGGLEIEKETPQVCTSQPLSYEAGPNRHGESLLLIGDAGEGRR